MIYRNKICQINDSLWSWILKVYKNKIQYQMTKVYLKSRIENNKLPRNPDWDLSDIKEVIWSDPNIYLYSKNWTFETVRDRPTLWGVWETIQSLSKKRWFGEGWKM